MGEVAHSNLGDYLLNVGFYDRRKDDLKSPMRAWTGFLIQAIHYLHDMKIKHKDMKPANILIIKGQVLLADFGISKDFIHQETTASINSNGDVGTRIYSAPIPDPAFLMLEPDPRTRIIALQMVAQISFQEFGAEYLSIIKQSSCNHCRELPVMVNPNLPLHSCYRCRHPSPWLLIDTTCVPVC